MKNISEYFGCNVWTLENLKSSISNSEISKILESYEKNKILDSKSADMIANSMMNWAISKGATHYTHWFFPMTGLTAEKHDGFINKKEGRPILEFSYKELIRGESDASSFPSGGIRETFEARGYTVWDPTSNVFIKDNVLYIPTAYCSYNGEALDKKTPLLRSIDVINKECTRLLHLIGKKDICKVIPNVGIEQEYFLIPKDVYEKRLDLVLTGKTLFGAKPPKTQELDDHFFGTINKNVKSFMEEVDEKLYELGIFAKTEHKEVAPLQYELACMYEDANLSLDHNQLVMEIMKKTALSHNLVCVFYEKPFDYVNGSGKHNNYSLITDKNINLFDPQQDVYNNYQFLLLISGVIKATDEYQDLFRISAASSSNDYRLGTNEAPPAIVSLYLGDEITSIFESIKNHEENNCIKLKNLRLGVKAIPEVLVDNSDRNRTSPFAFTGNKFEFRMLGSKSSIAEINTIINTTLAKVYKEYADIIEKELYVNKDIREIVHSIIESTIKKHERVLFNGNGYSKEWELEAERRGLLNLKTTPDAISHMLDEKNIQLFESMNVLNKKEYVARYDIMVKSYLKKKRIEANTMIEMTNTMYIPSIDKEILNEKRVIDIINEVDSSLVTYDNIKITKLINIKYNAFKTILEIENVIKKEEDDNKLNTALEYKNVLIPLLTNLRKNIDEAEIIVDRDNWKGPRYIDILFKYKK